VSGPSNVAACTVGSVKINAVDRRAFTQHRLGRDTHFGERGEYPLDVEILYTPAEMRTTGRRSIQALRPSLRQSDVARWVDPGAQHCLSAAVILERMLRYAEYSLEPRDRTRQVGASKAHMAQRPHPHRQLRPNRLGVEPTLPYQGGRARQQQIPASSSHWDICSGRVFRDRTFRLSRGETSLHLFWPSSLPSVLWESSSIASWLPYSVCVLWTCYSFLIRSTLNQ